MRYVVYAVPDGVAEAGVQLVEREFGMSVPAFEVAAGSAFEAALAVLPLCDSLDLHSLRVDMLPAIHRRVSAEERTRKRLEEEERLAGGPTLVISEEEVLAEFDRAGVVVREERGHAPDGPHLVGGEGETD